MTKRSTMLAAVLGILALAASGQAADYILTDLGRPDGMPVSFAGNINSNGQAVGWSGWDWTPNSHAWKYDGGSLIDLGTLAGTSYAYDINNAGTVVGYYSLESLGPYHALVWSASGAMTDIHPGATGSSAATAVNAGGQIVGYVAPESGNQYAFRYDGNTLVDLNSFVPAGSGWQLSAAYNINTAGQIVGEGTLNGLGHAFLLSADGSTLTDLGTIDGSWAAGWDINDGNVVVGSAYDASYVEYAFRWDSAGGRQILGHLDGDDSSMALGINSSGVIVGHSYLSSDSAEPTAFVYKDGEMIDLNTLIDPSLGWTLVWACGINDRGQIIGTGYNANHEENTFLLTPVPEPGMLVLLGCMGLGLLAYAGRRRPWLLGMGSVLCRL
jgi:probable HAF family extracellular repeat protein